MIDTYPACIIPHNANDWSWISVESQSVRFNCRVTSKRALVGYALEKWDASEVELSQDSLIAPMPARLA